jgi:hypothetical protein
MISMMEYFMIAYILSDCTALIPLRFWDGTARMTDVPWGNGKKIPD